MSTITSHARVIREWEALLAALEENLPDLPNVGEQVTTLRQKLETVKDLKGRQKSLTANRQKVTQDLNAELASGRELVIQLRILAKGQLGPRNEKLVQFGVAPLRTQPRRPAATRAGKAKDGQEAADGETAA